MKIIIRKIRVEKGLKLEAVAKPAGVAVSSLSDYETGVTPPNIFVLENIAKAMGVRITDLFESEYK